MDKNIEIYKKEILDKNNTLLENYNNLIYAYEDSRECYNKILQEYEVSDTSSYIKCNTFVGYLIYYPRVIKWSILLLDGTVIYESGKYAVNSAWTLEISTLNIEPGTNLKIRAFKATEDSNDDADTCDKIFTYTPDSNATAYLEYKLRKGTTLFVTSFLGTIPLYYSPNADSYLNCNGIYITNNSFTVAKFGLYTLEGVELFVSGNYSKPESWSTPFQDIGIPEGTLLIVKAIVMTGEDSVSEIIMKYVPDSFYQAKFVLCGSTNDTSIMYQGTDKSDPGELVTIPASSIVIYNLANLIAKWQIMRLDGTPLYTTDKTVEYDTWSFDLNSLSLEPGTLYRIKAVVTGREDLYSTEVFEYEHSSATAYYEYTIKNTHSYLTYTALVPSGENPPVLKCSAIAAKHTEYPVIMRWRIISASTGSVLHESGRCAKGDTWSYSLSNLNIAAGTQLKLKAAVTAGSDSIAYIILEYDPTSEDTATFGFYGNAFKTVIPYNG